MNWNKNTDHSGEWQNTGRLEGDLRFEAAFWPKSRYAIVRVEDPKGSLTSAHYIPADTDVDDAVAEEWQLLRSLLEQLAERRAR